MFNLTLYNFFFASRVEKFPRNKTKNRFKTKKTNKIAIWATKNIDHNIMQYVLMFIWLCLFLFYAVQHNIHFVHNVSNNDNGSGDDVHVDDGAHTHYYAVRVLAQRASCAGWSTCQGRGLLPGGEIYADEPLVRILLDRQSLRFATVKICWM